MIGGPKSLGLATDILVLGNRAQLEPHPLGWELRTPDEPDFWYGNQLILRGEPPAPDEAIAAFHEAFPQAEHVTLSWDAPERSLADDLDDLAERGFVIEQDDVLSLEARPAQAVPPNGFRLREVECDERMGQGLPGVDGQGATVQFAPRLEIAIHLRHDLTHRRVAVS